MLALLLVLSIKAFAQTFEGTITWSVDMEITDPAVKAQMAESQKAMQDPAKIKEMEEQMNSPQFKAMMEQNPQMKEQMERMLAMMKSGGGMNSMMPSGMILKIKDKNSLFKMEGGIVVNEFLSLDGETKTYSINRENKTYAVMEPPAQQQDNTGESKAKVTKTDERATIAGYPSTKYIVESMDGGTKTVSSIWATTELKGVDYKSMAKRKFTRSKQNFFYEEIEGFPMKVVQNLPQGTVTIEVKSVKKESLPASDFVAPSEASGYKLVKGMGL